MKAIDFRHDLLPLKDILFRVALRITTNTAEAEDVTQETLLRVWNHRNDLHDVRSLEAYCLTICRNLALDRSRKSEAQNLSLDEHAVDPADTAYTADEQLVRSERLRWVHTLFNRLPEKQRTVLQLRDVEGKSYRETADILGISEDQVRVTLFRARQAIRQQFEKIDNYGL